MFNPNMPNHDKPRFKSEKSVTQSFKTDRARIIDGKLLLDKPNSIPKNTWYGIKMSEQIRFEGPIKLLTVIQKVDGLFASFSIDTERNELPENDKIEGVDVNVGHFDYTSNPDNPWTVTLDKLLYHYDKIKHYQRLLARKRKASPNNFRTKRYYKIRIKLQREYKKVLNLQNDSLNKFTHMLIHNFGELHIEDLNVNNMKMNKRFSKGLHHSMFGRFKNTLEYKSDWYGRKLVKADRFYASTQICSRCGYRKTEESYGGKMTASGDNIYHDHNTYRCYECGLAINRDANAAINLKNYYDAETH